MKSKNYLYLVEGETEEKLVSVLKTEMQIIVPGKIQKFNILQESLPKSFVQNIKRNTAVVCIFDTDIDDLNLSIFKENVKKFHDAKPIVNNVIYIPQVRNLEDELVRATDIKKVQDLLPSSSIKEYKRDLAQIKRDRLALKLRQHHFDIDKLWYLKPEGKYKSIENGSDKIKQRDSR